MRVHRRTVMFFGNDRNLYMCPVYTWGTSLETCLVTGALFFVAPRCRLADLSACKFGLRVWVFLSHRITEMATGSPGIYSYRSRDYRFSQAVVVLVSLSTRWRGIVLWRACGDQGISMCLLI